MRKVAQPSLVEEENGKNEDQNSDALEKWNALKLAIDRAELIPAGILDALRAEDLL